MQLCSIFIISLLLRTNSYLPKNPNNIVTAYSVIRMNHLQPNFNISNKVMTIQILNSTLERLSKKSAIFEERFPKRKKIILTRFSSDNLNKLKGKQNHNSLFDCQACYKSATLKSALSLFTNLNKYKIQGKQIVVCFTTWNWRNKLFIYCMIQTKSTAKNTRQLLQNKPKKYLTFLTQNRLHVPSKKILNCK